MLKDNAGSAQIHSINTRNPIVSEVMSKILSVIGESLGLLTKDNDNFSNDSTSLGHSMISISGGGDGNNDLTVPLTTEDVEEVFRNAKSVKGGEVQYYYNHQEFSTTPEACRVGEIKASPFQHPESHLRDKIIQDVFAKWSESRGGSFSDGLAVPQRAIHLTEAMFAHLSSSAPSDDARMNPFYALANGYGVVVRRADLKSHKIEWICKGLTASPDSLLFDEASFVTCDIVCAPKGFAFGVSLFNAICERDTRTLDAPPVWGYLIMTIGGRSRWSVPKMDDTVQRLQEPQQDDDGFRIFETRAGDLHFVNEKFARSGHLSHMPDSHFGATLCIFAFRRAPSLDAVMLDMVKSSLLSDEAKSSVRSLNVGTDREAFESAKSVIAKGLSYEKFIQHKVLMVSSRSTERKREVERSVKAVQLPLSSLTKIRLSPTVVSILDVRDWRVAARTDFEVICDPSDAELANLLWQPVLDAFEEANREILRCNLSHLVVIQRLSCDGSGDVLRIRCTSVFGQVVALLNHRKPSSISIGEIASYILRSSHEGWDFQRALAVVGALGALGVILRVQG